MHWAYTGDSREVLANLEPDSIDSFVTDPPYELGFMGRSWDNSVVSFDPELWALCLRALKPGGHLVAFGGSRTFHRIAVAIEDAGFEIRDTLSWLYGSGFPKSHDISKAIDKRAGAEREVVSTGNPVKRMIPGADQNATGSWIKDNGREYVPTVTAPSTEDAATWDGWGTALKPAWEPIILARKPFKGTVASNVLTYGTGALNIDGSRLPDRESVQHRPASASGVGNGGVAYGTREGLAMTYEGGRWPPNVAMDEDAANLLGDRSRFMYVAKASKRERNRGLDDFPDQQGGALNLRNDAHAQRVGNSTAPAKNTHPTVKPVSLMCWLVRMVTPPDGIVCDPFMGSGSTGVASVLEGFHFFGIDMLPENVAIADARIMDAVNNPESWT